MPRPRLALVPPAPLGLPRAERDQPAPDQIYAALRRALLRLRPPPGAPVSEAAVAAEAGVSRTPVREALRRLREEGLIEVRPSLGTYASRLSAAEQSEAVAIRRLLEGEAIAGLAARGAGPRPVLRRLLAGQRAALESGDREALYALDESFHAALFAEAGLTLSWAAVRTARAHMERVHHAAAPTRPAEAVAGHAAVLARIEAGDPDGARAAMVGHVEANAADLGDLAARHPDWFRP